MNPWPMLKGRHPGARLPYRFETDPVVAQSTAALQPT